MAVRANRGRNKRATVTAQHVERLDIDGNPQVKTFTQDIWDKIPSSHYIDKTGITHRAKGGWLEDKGKSLADVPKRLKEMKKAGAPGATTKPIKETKAADVVTPNEAVTTE
jgi:hypothetical protein